MIQRIQLYINTIRYLKLVQILNRLRRHIPTKLSILSSTPELRDYQNPLLPGLPKPVSMTGANSFTFLNFNDHLSPGENWSNAGNSHLWQYNLHYFDDLVAPQGKARRLWHNQFIDRWIKEQAFGSSPAWDAYPTSLRIVNWIKSHHAGNPLTSSAINSLANQTHWLEKHIEWHLLGNHLFVNAKALVWAGCFFDGIEGERWMNKGLDILDQQIDQQILPDGGHFELSPMYHALVLEDLLDLIALANCYDQHSLSQRTELFKQKAQKMLTWLKIMSHPDGEISFFNDAAFGIAHCVDDLETYALKLGIKITQMPKGSLKSLPDSGYYRIDRGPFTIFADLAEIGAQYIPGHGHADCLSFELSIDDFRVMVNGGTSIYGAGKDRQWERSTASHNTVIVDGKNSSEIWSGFRVARRALPSIKVLTDTLEETQISASHNGYARLKYKPVHHRNWICNNRQIIIEDEVSPSHTNAVARFILHPHISISSQESGQFILKLPNGRTFLMELPHAEIKQCFYAPEFGKRQPTLVLEAPLIDGQCRAVFSL